MIFSDYNDLILQNTETTNVKCLSCQLDATLKYIQIKEVEPEILLVIFECKHCNVKDINIFNEKSGHKKLVIECHFTDKEDLKREVNLNIYTQLFIEFEDVKYEHESSLPVVNSVEGLINQAINALSGQKDTIFGDKDKMAKAVEKLKTIKDNPVFYMRIEDKDGFSRVGRINRGVYEMQNCPLKDFNDEKVCHSFID